MKLTKCPYCGKKINYMKAFFMRSQGEYFCNKCKKESNVIIKKTIFIPFIIAVVFALLILLAFLMLTDRENLWFMLFIAVPFVIFYIFTPFFVELKPKKKHMDSLYDTAMIEAANEPDVTVKKKRVAPTFIDNVILDDDDYKPSIDADIFNSIKNERKVIADTDGGTRPVESFEEISSKTMPVGNIKDVQIKNKAVKIDESKTEVIEENLDEIKDKINSVLETDDSKETGKYDFKKFE